MNIDLYVDGLYSGLALHRFNIHKEEIRRVLKSIVDTQQSREVEWNRELEKSETIKKLMKNYEENITKTESQSDSEEEKCES